MLEPTMNVDRQEPNSLSQECGASLPYSVGNSSVLRSSRPEFVKGMGDMQEDRSRRQFRWSKAARDLVRANIDASGNELSALVTQLVGESGNPRWACRRFVGRMGVRSKRSQRSWTTQEQQRLLKLIDLHPVREISRLMRRSQSSIWHMLQRLGANAKMGKDSFTKYTLAVALHVRREKIEDWIARGWLKARELETGRSKRVVIDAEAFCEFCRKHTRDVVGNRLTEERLDFVYHFVFPPSHATLLPVRESLKENNAYQEQMKGKHAARDTAGFGSEDADEDHMLSQSA
jgi:hypothetical protein